MAAPDMGVSLEGAMALGLCCDNCGYFSRGSDEAIAKRAAAGMHEGHCRRGPTPLPRNRDYLCGEHSAIDLERQRRLAAAIGASQETR
jgi:hypothetical protein